MTLLSSKATTTMDHPIACEARAFFIVDALSEGALVWARKALLHLGSTLALAVKRPPPIGIAVLQRKGPKQSTQLQASEPDSPLPVLQPHHKQQQQQCGIVV
jgi:hypothetical protein